MSRDKRASLTGRASFAKFAGIPFSVLESANYRNLTAYGKALLLDIRAQYRGFNNGNLDATWSRLRKQNCWRSKQTVNHAIQELIYYGFIICVRKGKRIGGTHYPSLYALTWEPIDDLPKQGVRATMTAGNQWREPRERWVPRKRESKREDKSQQREEYLPSTLRVVGQVQHVN